METEHYKTALNTLKKMTCKERIKILDQIYTIENLHGFVYYCEECGEPRQGNLSDPYYCSNCNDSICADCAADDSGAIISCKKCEVFFCRECAEEEMTIDDICIGCACENKEKEK